MGIIIAEKTAEVNLSNQPKFNNVFKIRVLNKNAVADIVKNRKIKIFGEPGELNVHK